jgi:hypothetical protein
MKKILFSCFSSVLLLGMFAVNAMAPNFAGTWVLDKAKSQMPGPMGEMVKSITWTITQDANQITVTPKTEMNEGAAPPGGGGRGGGRGGGMGMGGNQPRTFKLDGSEVVTETQRGKSTTKAKLSDTGLEITTQRSFNENTFTTKEHWTLTDGGKSLKAHSSTETPQGAREQTLVFNKQ